MVVDAAPVVVAAPVAEAAPVGEVAPVLACTARRARCVEDVAAGDSAKEVAATLVMSPGVRRRTRQHVDWRNTKDQSTIRFGPVATFQSAQKALHISTT